VRIEDFCLQGFIGFERSDLHTGQPLSLNTLRDLHVELQVAEENVLAGDGGSGCLS
jgi:hypothetical protein